MKVLWWLVGLQRVAITLFTTLYRVPSVRPTGGSARGRAVAASHPVMLYVLTAFAGGLALMSSPRALADPAYQWAVTYTSGYTWHNSPYEAVQEYVQLYTHAAGCSSSPCTGEVVYVQPGTWPSFTEQIQYWDKNGNRWWVAAGSVTYRTNGTLQYFVSARAPKPQTQGPCCNVVGDPINPANGEVYYSEADLTLPGSPITFSRFYNSQDPNSTRLSPGWRYSYTRSVAPRTSSSIVQAYISDADTSSPYSTAAQACTTGFAEIRGRVSSWVNATASFASGVCSLSVGGATIGNLPILSTATSAPGATAYGFDVTRDNGQVISFVGTGSSINAPPGVKERLVQTATGYTLTDADDNVEVYDTNGRLVSITTRAGVGQTMQYDTNGRLIGVTDGFGYHISLTYDNPNDRLSKITDPNGKAIQYAYDSAKRLSTVAESDSTTRGYVYENANFPNALTGVTDENGARYSTWAYDSQGRATGTSEAGGREWSNPDL